MADSIPHISVCVCAYKRPALLERSLKSLCVQQPDGLFTFSIVVTDNDAAETARATCERIPAGTATEIKYCMEPVQGIARARNRAVANATGDYIAFLDDDEFVPAHWLKTLYLTLGQYKADGVLGPVDPHFDADAPHWVIEGKFYDRPVQPTGMQLRWKQCRTGNVLLKAELFRASELAFDPACLSGEDQDFFRRKIGEGKSFVWCHEAGALEVVPSIRWKRSFLLKRAMFRGIFAQKNHGIQPVRMLQAIISVPLYVLALPVAFILGQTKFMTCMFKLSYHAGRLLGFVGINPFRQSYVTE